MGIVLTFKRRWLDVYLVFVGVVSTYYGYRAALLKSGWAIGEWLIDYSGGFVRRGLLGEFILLLGKLTHISLPWLVLAVQAAVYWTMIWYIHRLASGVRWGLGMTILLLSPATLAFVVLDPPSGFKKELLLFAVLAWLLCLLLTTGQSLPGWQLSALLSLVLPALVLTHEPLVIYFPYLFAALAILHGGWRRAASLVAVPALVCIAAALAAVTHPGTMQTAASICSSVGGIMPDLVTGNYKYKTGLCDGGISSLTVTLQQSHQLTMEGDRAANAIPIYSALAVPSLLPMILVLMSRFRQGRQRQVRTILACAACAAVLSLALFYGATDYGRWIHMHAMCLMLLCFALYPAPGAQGEPAAAFQAVPAAWRPAVALGLLLWTTCWNLPAVLIYPSRTGYFGLYAYIHSYAADHQK